MSHNDNVAGQSSLLTMPHARSAAGKLRVSLVPFFGRNPRWDSPFPVAILCCALVGLVGCDSRGEPALVIATGWSADERAWIVELIEKASTEFSPILWIKCEPGENLAKVLDRRGGVDIVLAGSSRDYRRLADSDLLAPVDPSDPVPWMLISRQGNKDGSPGDLKNSQEESTKSARSTLAIDTDIWRDRLSEINREASSTRPNVGSRNRAPTESRVPECVALVKGSPRLDRARRFFQRLENLRLVELAANDAKIQATADDLRSDLLDAASIDSRDEFVAASRAVRRSGRDLAPTEVAIGDRPPWPPASIESLLESPDGDKKVETLLEQLLTDPEARTWLAESWARPRKPIDGAFLTELAGAADGRLARDPRFRAWLRSEWTAWNRQLYQEVARMAKGASPP